MILVEVVPRNLSTWYGRFIEYTDKNISKIYVLKSNNMWKQSCARWQILFRVKHSKGLGYRFYLCVALIQLEWILSIAICFRLALAL